MSQYTVAAGDRADGTAFTVPGDEDGGEGDDSFALDDADNRSKKHTYVHVNNGWDVNADVTLQGSNYLDEAMDAPVDDGAAETVNSGTADAFDTEVAHSFVQINVDPATTPTSGDLVVTFQVREA